MRARVALALELGVAVGLLAANAEAGGAVVIDHDALVAYVADADNKAMHRIDLVSYDVTTTDLPCAPEQVEFVDGSHVAVTLRGCNQVALVEVDAAGDGKVTATAKVATDPFAIARTPRGELLVTSAWGHALTAFDATTLDRKFTLDLPKEPRGIAVTRDGRRAFVTHLSSDKLSVIDLVPNEKAEGPRARSVAALGGLYKNRVEADAGAGSLHPTSSLAYTAVLNATGTRVFVPHLVVQNGSEEQHRVSAGYGSVAIEEDTTAASTAVLSVESETVLGGVHESKRRPPRVLIPPNARVGFAVLPAGSRARQARAAAVLGDTLLVASLGTDELVELDARSLDPSMSPRRSFKVGSGPTGVDVDPTLDVAVVWTQFSHDVSIVGLGSGAVETVDVDDDPLDDDLAAGRRMFFSERDTRTSRDGRACAACHPDGREDGIVWKLGGPRQTPMLAGRLDRGPFGWFAEHATLEDHVRDTMTRLGGSGLPNEDLAHLTAFLRKGLTPPVRAASSDAEVAHGRELFVSDKTGCTNCHRVDKDLSDHDLHDVGSQSKTDASAKFRTPPLRFVEGTAPYFHDGRYATLEALVADNLDRMGSTTQLSKQDATDLVAFLRTL